MAIIRLDCNLNGGDSVTPNNELFYRIYGDVDGYVTPIHTTGTALSDVNVTVDSDRVIITGVDGATNTIFKIAAVDLAGNEGVLSDAFELDPEYMLLFSSAESSYATLASNLSVVGDFEFEFKCEKTINNSLGYFLCSNTSANNMTWSSGQVWKYDDGVTAVQQTIATIPETGSGLVKWKRVGNDVSIYFDDVLQHTFVAVGSPTILIRQLCRLSAVEGDMAFEWMKWTVNGGGVETFPLNEGSGNTITGDLGTVMTLHSDTNVDDIWIEL